MPEIKRILVGIDYSEYSREAARYAVYLARHLKARVDYLHVCDQPAYIGTGYGPYNLAPLKHYLSKQKDLEKGALDDMKRFVGEFEREGIEVDYLITTGHAPAEIIRIAEDRRADLIVLGSHGRTGISQILIGSVAEKVVRKAKRPVLTVTLTSQTFVMSG